MQTVSYRVRVKPSGSSAISSSIGYDIFMLFAITIARKPTVSTVLLTL
ncbi:hypothetical protein AB0758_46295 [Tolypothrix bouteillei VB521301_2]